MHIPTRIRIRSRHGAVAATVLRHPAPLPLATLGRFLDHLAGAYGAQLLRLKGLAWTRETPDRPLVVQGVRGFLHPPARLARWPEGWAPETRLVLIGENLDASALADLFAAYAGEPRLDAPDRAALADNPLAVPNWSAAAARR